MPITSGFVQLPDDSGNTGKLEDHVIIGTQYREVVAVGDPQTLNKIAPVDATNGLAVDPKTLPPGAANQTKQDTGNTTLAAIDTNAGAQSDAAVTGDNSGTISAKLRGLIKIFGDVWDSTNHWLKVSLQASSAVIGHIIVDSGTITTVSTVTSVTAIAGALPAGSNVIGHVIADSGSTTAVTQATAANLNATVVGTGTFATQAAATQSGTWTVQPGNTANTTPWLVTAGHGKTIKSASGSITSDTDIIAAVTSKRIKVIGYAFFTFGNSANVILLKSNGTGGTLLWTVVLQAGTDVSFGANMAVSAPSFIFATAAGEKLTADVNQSDTIYWSISYYDDDAS